MRIEDSSGRAISSLDDWAALYDTPSRERHWKRGRSAYSIADFVLNHSGLDRLRDRVSEAAGVRFEIDTVKPEHEVRFDEHGRGRVHDLAIWGHTDAGKRVFIGVEAKVDEPFGPSVKDRYLEAKARQIAGESTNAPARIEKLLGNHFTTPDPSMFDIPYQLLYGVAGTCAVPSDVAVFYVVVFHTNLFDPVKGAANFTDYVRFLTALRAEPHALATKAAVAHSLTMGDRTVRFLHEAFDLDD